MRGVLGFGFNWGRPNEISFAGADDQYTTELFWRYQLTTELAVTPSIQFIKDPARAEQVQLAEKATVREMAGSDAEESSEGAEEESSVSDEVSESLRDLYIFIMGGDPEASPKGPLDLYEGIWVKGKGVIPTCVYIQKGLGLFGYKPK